MTANVKIKPILSMAEDSSKNIRSGTENVPGIAGLSLAAKTIYEDLDEKVEKMRRRESSISSKAWKRSRIRRSMVYMMRRRAPHIISVGIAGIRSEVLSACAGR